MQTDIDTETLAPFDTLTSDAISWCREHGSDAKTVDDVINDVKLNDVIQRGFDEYNRNAKSRVQRIQRWTILPADFSIAGGELGLRNKVLLLCSNKPASNLELHFTVA